MEQLFHYWMTDHFLAHSVTSRPLLLLLDDHSSHFKPKTIQFAWDHNVVVFSLPPHTTRVAITGLLPIKVHLRNVCHSLHEKHPTAVIMKFNFCGLFKEAWLQVITPENVTGGFRKAGAYTYDISALKKTGESSGAKAGDDMSTASSSGSAGVASDDGAGGYEDIRALSSASFSFPLFFTSCSSFCLSPLSLAFFLLNQFRISFASRHTCTAMFS